MMMMMMPECRLKLRKNSCIIQCLYSDVRRWCGVALFYCFTLLLLCDRSYWLYYYACTFVTCFK